jgi:hypothetical protein
VKRAALMTVALLVGCASWTKQDTQMVIAGEKVACVLVNAALDVPALRTFCKVTDEEWPIIEPFLLEHRKAMAAKKCGPVKP